MQVSNDESWLFSSIVAWFYFSICVQLRGCKNDIIKVLLFSKILISPSRAEFRFHRRACVCDADTWLGKCFKLILNSFPLMSIHRCAVSRLCGIWGWQSHKRYFWLRQSNNIRLRQWREKSMHCRPIASINWLRMMERSSKWSQKKLSPFVKLTMIGAAWHLVVEIIFFPLFFKRSLLSVHVCWYCQSVLGLHQNKSKQLTCTYTNASS